MIISPSNRVANVSTYYFATKLAEIAQLNAEGKNIINLGIGSPDLLPPKEVIDQLHESAKSDHANKYQSYRGIASLRKAFSDWYAKYFKVNLDPLTEVLPLIGSKEGIMHIAMSFLEAGDEALVPNPGYPAYAMTTKLAGAKPIYYELDEQDGWLPNFSELEKKDLSRVKIMWLNYPNMPTGAVATKSLFEDLIVFANRHKILLVHDNPYAFILNDKPLSLLSIEGSKEVAIELNSLSKCYNMAGWRVGVMSGAKSYIDTVMRFKSNMDSGMYKPIQEAAITALSMNQSWFDNQNHIYTRRRNIVHKIMDAIDCQYDKDSVGLFVWGKISKQWKDARELVDQLLYERKVFITPGFIFGSKGEGYIRISLCANEETLTEALNRIVMQNYKE